MPDLAYHPETCMCGSSALRPDGGHYSSGRYTAYFVCLSCSRPMMTAIRELMVTFQPKDLTWSEAVANIYLATDFEVAMRDFTVRAEAARRTDAGADVDALPFALPRLPRDMVAWVWRRSTGWVAVDHAQSALVPVPPDPMRIQHDAYFNRIFKQVTEKTGVTLRHREIPNEYYDDQTWSEPWFHCEHGDATLTIGPRKRVISIRAKREQPFPVSEMQVLADRDKVTFLVMGAPTLCGSIPPRKDIPVGGKLSDLPMATNITIHAWEEERAVEYLTTLLKALG